MLPAWLKQDADNAKRFYADLDVVYPKIIDAMKEIAGASFALDQYAAELAYTIMRRAALDVLDFSGIGAGACTIITTCADKTKWNLAAFPVGRPLNNDRIAAEGREIYQKIRAKLFA